MKILSLNYSAERDSFYVQYNDGEEYGRSWVSRDECSKKAYPNQFRDPKHFAEYIGEFNPFTRILSDPPNIESLTYENLEQIRDRFKPR